MSLAEVIVFPRADFSAALAGLPQPYRGDFLERLLNVPATASSETEAAGQGGHTSFPIDVVQARQLSSKIDGATAAVLKAAVSNVTNGVGTVTYQQIKDLTGVDRWSSFAQGRLAGLHRSLRNIVNDSNAVLLQECPGWVPDGHGDFAAGEMKIDGPAVRSLQIVFGVQQPAA